jgi:hypothetical protein
MARAAAMDGPETAEEALLGAPTPADDTDSTDSTEIRTSSIRR